MAADKLARDVVLRVGEVVEVSGQRVTIRVDRHKNSSDLLFDGDVLRNVSVDSYVEIRKGFYRLIGRVTGEKLDEFIGRDSSGGVEPTDKNRRFLYVSLSGFIGRTGKFEGGLRELPLIGNEVYLVTKETVEAIHDLVGAGRTSVSFAVTDNEGFEIAFPVDGLFNSHVAIFGNTGSGKSNTLARMYAEFVEVMTTRNAKSFRENVRIVLIDFNGEYVRPNCITQHKTVYELSTRKQKDRLPLPNDALLDIEMLSILVDATEKTQKPFLKRAIDYYRQIFAPGKTDSLEHFKNMLRKQVMFALAMTDKERADNVLTYLRAILPKVDEAGQEVDVRSDIDWHNSLSYWYMRPSTASNLQTNEVLRQDTQLYKRVDAYTFADDTIARLIDFVYLQLVRDIITNGAQNEHIAPVVHRLEGKRKDIARIFDTSDAAEFWASNVVVVSLDGVNIEMKKAVPLLLAKRLYDDHKQHRDDKAMIIIVDEAHNILSTASAREDEGWKDYRLETFEEIIKEGRKFGVFLTISSQRPNDISPTITSQAHNYFIHRLVNRRDLETISSAVSYIDEVTERSIPTLPTGTCIFSGVAGQMPLKLRVRPLSDEARPRSETVRFDDLVETRQ
ncbi:MAG: DUF87 domain-containing protein [Hyphomonadaceae bacterium]|nr:DUF87 domain-containing protein [Hyphomonadaceae bacterium]